MWAFVSMHPANAEILQRLKSADDRQFGSNMDVCGSISQRKSDGEPWEETHIVGIRSDIWNPDRTELQKALNSLRRRRRAHHRRAIRKSGRLSRRQSQQLDRRLQEDALMSLDADDIEKRRLVLKLFASAGKSIRWCGTIEEVTTREIHNSLGSRRALLSLAAVISGYEYLTIVQENRRTLRMPPIFTFCFYDERRKRMWYVNILRKWFSIGADYVIESEGRRIGEIDGKLIGFGYNAHVAVYEPTLSENQDFLDLVTLFAASVGYHRAMRKSLKRRVAAIEAGRVEQHVIEDEEFWLLKNPRRRAA
jgi:hypothetical protein